MLSLNLLSEFLKKKFIFFHMKIAILFQEDFITSSHEAIIFYTNSLKISEMHFHFGNVTVMF